MANTTDTLFSELIDSEYSSYTIKLHYHDQLSEESVSKLTVLH